MKENLKKKETSSEKLSMKEALEGIPISKNKRVTPKKEKVDLRDFFWNYPLFIAKAFKKMIPLSYIVIFLIVGVTLSVFLQSNAVARMLDDSKSRDTFIEGSVGGISTFNPLFLSVNYIDKTIQELVFDRFVYIDIDGNPLPGIAKEWVVSEDKLRYEFDIKEDVYWQDGIKLNMEDILFTFNTAKALSEEYGFDSVGISLIGVDIEKKDQNTVVFSLKEPNPTFFEAVSIFIVPKFKLENEDLGQLIFNMFSRYPLGTGKYKVTRTEQNAVYLSDNKFDKFDPSIKNIVFKLFPDKESMEMSFRIGVLDAVGGWDYDLLKFTEEYSNLQKFTKVENYKTKVMFFNIRKDSLKQKDVRIGLNYLIDRDRLIKEANVGGNVRKGPFAEDSWVFNSNIEYYGYNPEKASEYFEKLGYRKNEESGYYESSNQEILSFTLSYFESITNERLVDVLKDILKEEGVILKTEKLNYNQITQEIIATRDFSILLYEIETTVDPDQYNIWHSLKTNYPDLNISGYTYERVDILLEDARKTSDRNVRKQKYDLFQRYLMADAPVVFLYNPSFYYFVKNSVKNVDIGNTNYSYERFSNIVDWELE
jgi:peptide/nickel transport system substrate-binding protein